MFGVYFVDLNLSRFVESTVYSYVAKAAVPKRLYVDVSLSLESTSHTNIDLEHRYKLDKAITNAKTNDVRLRRRTRVCASNRRRETSTTPAQNSSNNDGR